MSGITVSIKLVGVALLTAAVFVAVFVTVRDGQSLPYRYWSKYVAHLERKLRNMFIMTKGSRIASAQLVAAAGTLGMGLYFGAPQTYLAIPVILVGPTYYIDYMKKRRLQAIEAKIDSFILTLANALKSTPSIGNALSYSQTLLSPPLDEEVALALKEMRVGNTVDQALLNMSSRIQSLQLDATLSSILIGRQVGGDLTKILETTAATLREIARLQGVVRAKTSEGKAQIGLLAALPPLIMVMFDSVSPGYFEPLAASALGWVVVICAAGCWLSSIIVARKVLAVDI